MPGSLDVISPSWKNSCVSGKGVRKKPGIRWYWVWKSQTSPAVTHSRALSRDSLHQRNFAPQKAVAWRLTEHHAKLVISFPVCLLGGMVVVVYLVGRSLFLSTLGKKGTALFMFTESLLCSSRHEDRARPYKSGWEKIKMERNGLRKLQRQRVCMCALSQQGEWHWHVSKEGHRIDHKSQTLRICFICLR